MKSGSAMYATSVAPVRNAAEPCTEIDLTIWPVHLFPRSNGPGDSRGLLLSPCLQHGCYQLIKLARKPQIFFSLCRVAARRGFLRSRC